MAKKNLFNKIDIKKIDSDFSTLLASNGSNQKHIHAIADYIRLYYFPVAYIFAGDILSKSGGFSDFENDSSELAVDAMEDIILAVTSGELSFTGKSAFSTYLYGVLLNKNREGAKIYYPAEVKRQGLAAITAYRLLLIEGYDSFETARILDQEHGLDWDHAYQYIALAESYREDETQRKRKRHNAAEDASYDALIEAGAPVDNHPSAGGKHPTPPDALIRQEQREILRNAVNLLPEPAKSVVTGYILDEKWETMQEMEAELGLKNGSYELKKAKQMLRELMG